MTPKPISSNPITPPSEGLEEIMRLEKALLESGNFGNGWASLFYKFRNEIQQVLRNSGRSPIKMRLQAILDKVEYGGNE